MTWMTLGSLSLPFHLNRNTVKLRDEMARLSIELTSGEAANPQRSLRGDLGPLNAVESRLSRLAAHVEAGKQAAAAADLVQSILTRAADSGSVMASRMLGASNDGVAPEILRGSSLAALTALDELSASTAQTLAGRTLFSGTATDTRPLPDSAAILDTILPTLAGLATHDEIVSAVNAAFLEPGGLFETAIYQGGPAAGGAMIDTAERAPALPTAADPTLRRLMAGLVISALAGHEDLPLVPNQRQALGRAGAEALMGAAAGMATLQARVGETQALLDATQTRQIGERDALTLARQTMIGTDPYEVAGQLQLVQTRLEVLYSVTARTARLSLTEYL